MLKTGMRAVVVAGVMLATGCILKTDMVSAAFNGGALDSPNDPFRVTSDLAASRVERIVEQELSDGYFHQGKDGKTTKWLDKVTGAELWRVVDTLNKPSEGDEDAGTTSNNRTRRAHTAKKRSDAAIETGIGSRDPICKPETKPFENDALESFVDEVRFREAMWRAERRVAALALEGLVNKADVINGANTAFAKTKFYLGNRKWTRREQLKTAGLAVKGGAASGIFSAGVVWVALHLIDNWLSACTGKDCPAKNDIRFRLISGTSTGAMVAVAVDRFNTAVANPTARKAEMANIAKWFTCYSFADLMCAQSRSLLDLVQSDSSALEGVLRFDGIETLLNSCVNDDMFKNTSELILNTTEFRSGRIYTLSDQNELTAPQHVVQAALASALLPVIGDPAKQIPRQCKYDVEYDAGALDRTEPTYLDGGIRSELPILPLVRRGAERVLAVASGPSMIAEVKRLENGASIASRYIDVNTGAVTETEVEFAQRLVESARQAEIDSCMNELDPDGDDKAKATHVCDPATCNRWNVCHGDYANACTHRADDDDKHKNDAKGTLAQRIEPFFKMESIFIDQSSVDGLSGYDFKPTELRRLFRAGAEAARVRCVDLARLLGILEDEKLGSAPEIEKVNRWCAASMDTKENTCAGILESPPNFTMRTCGDVPLNQKALVGACQVAK